MDTVSLIISIGSAVLALGSAAFLVYTYYSNVVHDRKRDTLDAYNTLQEQVFDALNGYTAQEVRRIVDNHETEAYMRLSKYLARIEHFSVGVNTGIYDRKTVYALAHGYLDGAIWDKLLPLLERKNRRTQEQFYKNYCKLVAWMQEQSAK